MKRLPFIWNIRMFKIILLFLLIVPCDAQTNKIVRMWNALHNVILNESPFTMTVNTASISILMRGFGKIRINWDDASYTDYFLTNSSQTVSHTYTTSTTYTITIYNPSKITYWSSSDNAAYAFNWSETAKMRLTYFVCTGTNTLSGALVLPSGMTYFNCRGSNTLSGALALPSSMIYFTCLGSNTLSGALVLPSGTTHFDCQGSNTLSGALALPSGMTTFTCAGSNTLSGALSLPSGMTSFYCTGSNTLSGALALPSSMTYFVCTGTNTLSGALVLPSGMTYFCCTGTNTLSGALALPSSMTYFLCAGTNTLSGYSTQTFSNSMNYFYLITSNGTGFSAANVDQLCIDLNGSAWAGTSKTLRLTGTQMAAPTATSANARTSLAAKGVAITTN